MRVHVSAHLFDDLVSGEVPEQPVACRKTGHVYERRIIEKYLAEHEDTCPLTREPMTKEDLVSLEGELRFFLEVPEGRRGRAE
jgi:hypothetical protein